MAATQMKHLRVRDVDGVAVVGFVDSGLLYATELVHEIGDELKALLKEPGRAKLLLDFDAVQYVSSTMLAQLAHFERELRKSGGQLKICGLGPVLRDTFRLARFDSIFAIYDDEASALAHYH